jgi:hypothetical protein
MPDRGCVGFGRSGCWDRRETGVDSARALARCPRMPLGDGWPSRVRAVDAPALQDVPAWEGKCGLALRVGRRVTHPEPGKGELRRAPLTLLRAMREGCGSDSPWANSVCNKPLGDPPRSGSPLTRCGRSPVVFTEGADPGPSDRGESL